MGGVIVRTEDWDFRRRWEERLDLEAGELSRLVFEGQPSQRASVGQATVDEIWSSLARRLDLSADETAQLEADFWRGDRVDHDLVNYIGTLHESYRTALLSNAWPNVRGYIEDEWEIADVFDLIVISAEVGLVKPDPQIYQIALDGLDLPASACVFIDDFQRNVDGARAAGLHALLFESPQQIRRDLSDLLSD